MVLSGETYVDLVKQVGTPYQRYDFQNNFRAVYQVVNLPNTLEFDDWIWDEEIEGVDVTLNGSTLTVNAVNGWCLARIAGGGDTTGKRLVEDAFLAKLFLKTKSSPPAQKYRIWIRSMSSPAGAGTTRWEGAAYQLLHESDSIPGICAGLPAFTPKRCWGDYGLTAVPAAGYQFARWRITEGHALFELGGVKVQDTENDGIEFFAHAGVVSTAKIWQERFWVNTTPIYNRETNDIYITLIAEFNQASEELLFASELSPPGQGFSPHQHYLLYSNQNDQLIYSGDNGS